jgi:hypothetical protein
VARTATETDQGPDSQLFGVEFRLGSGTTARATPRSALGLAQSHLGHFRD